MQAIVIDPQSPQRVGFRSVEPPAPRATEALVRVKAISLNRGEIGQVARALLDRQFQGKAVLHVSQGT